MRKVTPTQLETMRRYRLGFFGDDEFVSRMLKVIRPTEEMTWGNVVHKSLETRQRSVECEGRSWRVNGAMPYPGVEIREALIEREFDGVLVRGKIDALTPQEIVDYKVSTRAPKWEGFFGSWQWQTYCLMLDMDRFVYRHVQIRRPRGRQIDVVGIRDNTLYLDREWALGELRDIIADLLETADSLGCGDQMVC